MFVRGFLTGRQEPHVHHHSSQTRCHHRGGHRRIACRLDPRYDVVPGMRMPRMPVLGTPRPDRPELILVSWSAMARAQVRIVRHSGQTDIRVTPGGMLINTIGIAAGVRRVLRDARDLRSSAR